MGQDQIIQILGMIRNMLLAYDPDYDPNLMDCKVLFTYLYGGLPYDVIVSQLLCDFTRWYLHTF